MRGLQELGWGIRTECDARMDSMRSCRGSSSKARDIWSLSRAVGNPGFGNMSPRTLFAERIYRDTLSDNGLRTDGSISEGNSPVVSIHTTLETGSIHKCRDTT